MPEKQNIEWKSKWKDEYLEWVCGFANAHGGKIYIGCDDNGTIIGVPRQVLSGLALESFLMKKRGATWDSLPLPAFSMEDVDDDVIEKFKKLAAKKGRIDKSVLEESKEVIMEKLHLKMEII